MVRLYVELAKLDVGERVANRNITADDVIAKAAADPCSPQARGEGDRLVVGL